MAVIGTLARRELSGLFYSPVGYLVLFAFLLYMGIIFVVSVFNPGQLPQMQAMFEWSDIVLMFAVPLFTMSLLSDEYRSGRMETLRTSPITESQIVLGKFAGAMGFYLTMVATTLIYLVILLLFSRPDFGPIWTSYLGLILMGGLFVSVGLFFSACTQHQIIAAISTIGVLAVVRIFAEFFANFFRPLVPPSMHWMNSVLGAVGYLAFQSHMTQFARGLIGLNDVVYFLSGIALFLFLTYLLLESRKWR